MAVQLGFGALCVAAAGAGPAPTLPPHIEVVETGAEARSAFPVTGAVPLPEGAVFPDQLKLLGLVDEQGAPVRAQFDVTGRWPDGSVQWLLLDFSTTQDAASKARYALRRNEDPGRWLIDDISLELPLLNPAVHARMAGRQEPIETPPGSERVAIVQENLFEPRYPEFYLEKEFIGRFRVLQGPSGNRNCCRYRWQQTV